MTRHSGFGSSTSGDNSRDAPPAPIAPKATDELGDKSKIEKLRRGILAFDESFERRGPPPPNPAPQYDQNDEDYDDMARFTASLAHSIADKTYREYQARRGMFFHQRFADAIRELHHVLGPTVGTEPRLQCLVGSYEIALDRVTMLYVAGHLEKVAREMPDNA